MDFTNKACPNCGHIYPSYEGYTDWCDACNWNLKPQKRIVFFDSIYEKIVKKIGDRYSQQLYEQIQTIDDVQPKIHWLTIVTFIVAAIVFLLWLGLIAADIWLFYHYPNFFAILGSILCTMMIWTFRPQFNTPPEKYLKESDAPVLFSIIDDLRERLGASQIDYIVIDHSFNASMGYIGIQRKRILTLGYPLLTVLDAQETIELISHELAHDVNRDPIRGYMQWYAASTLEKWYSITNPLEIITTDAGIYAMILSVPFNMVMWGVARVFLGVAYLLYMMMWRDSQRAEYYADYLAVTMSGNKSSESSFQKMAYANILYLAVQRAVLQRKGDSVFNLFQEAILNLPDREIERIHRVNYLRESRIDSSHPPTPYRIGFVRSRGYIAPGYILQEDRHKQLILELSKFRSEIEGLLIDDYKAAIYR